MNKFSTVNSNCIVMIQLLVLQNIEILTLSYDIMILLIILIKFNVTSYKNDKFVIKEFIDLSFM
jgi:hypothetical protein